MNFGDFTKEDQPEWNWVPHGDGWALMQGRCSMQHGLNKITVLADGFDWGGEEMRTLIARLLNEHADRQRAAQELAGLHERIAAVLFEPLVLPDGCPSLGERIMTAIDTLYREREAARSGEYEAASLISAWAPIVRSAIKQAAAAKETRRTPLGHVTGERWPEQCRETEQATEKLTPDQREAADP